jgi:hypothetical protein
MPFFSNSSKTANRHYLLCPRCLKTQASLSVHLRRVCLKDGSDADVNAIVDKAKHDADQFLILLKLWNISYESAWKLFGEMLGTQPHNLWCFFLFLNIIFRCSPQVLMRQHMCESYKLNILFHKVFQIWFLYQEIVPGKSSFRPFQNTWPHSCRPFFHKVTRVQSWPFGVPCRGKAA